MLCRHNINHKSFIWFMSFSVMTNDHLEYANDMRLQQLVIHSPLIGHLVYSRVCLKSVHP